MATTRNCSSAFGPLLGLIREDSFERPVIILPGSVYVTAGTTRRSTGTHYTPPSLTEPIVQYTLEPLAYRGPAEGLSREQWQLKSPKEILDLKVCDMAMGSGAFLVQACRYLAERLTEAWENEEKKHPGEMLATPEGGFSQGSPSERLVPQDATERLAIARRIIADRCLYGVDINPMAVEMAKLSLWLITLDAKRPFTFLDHAFKCGDSLLGLSSFKQLEDFTLRPEGGKQIAFSTMNLWRHVDEAKKKREALEVMPSDTPEQIAAKVALYAEAEEAVAKLRAAADVLVGVELKDLRGRAYEVERETAADQMLAYWAQGLEALRGYAEEQLGGRQTLHWPLAYPEIMDRGGFSAFIGNPPFMRGHDISGTFGSEYRSYLALMLNGTTAGIADLCAYFVYRATALINPESSLVGLIATNTISEGDTKRVGLELAVSRGLRIVSTWPNLKWPGNAAVVVSPIVLRYGQWQAACSISGSNCDEISTSLKAGAEKKAYPLIENEGRSFAGSYILGEGFIIEKADEDSFHFANPRTEEVVFPYINGIELNSLPDLIPTRRVICFWDWPIDKVQLYDPCFSRVRDMVKPIRDLVERDRNRELWWLHAENRPGLYHTIGCGGFFEKHPKNQNAGTSTRLHNCQGKNFRDLGICPSSPRTIFDQAITVIASDSINEFAVLQEHYSRGIYGRGTQDQVAL